MMKSLPHYDWFYAFATCAPGFAAVTACAACTTGMNCDAKGGGKGSSSMPAPPPPPPPPAKVQVQKQVTESTTVARDAQKERAAKASGIKGSILTDPLGVSAPKQQGKTLLGQ